MKNKKVNIKKATKEIVTAERVCFILGILIILTGIFFSFNINSHKTDPEKIQILAKVTNIKYDIKTDSKGKPYTANTVYADYEYNGKVYNDIEIAQSDSKIVLGEYLNLYLDKSDPSKVYFAERSWLPLLITIPMGLVWILFGFLSRKIDKPKISKNLNRDNKSRSIRIAGGITIAVGLILLIIFFLPALKDTSNYEVVEADIEEIVPYSSISNGEQFMELVAYVNYSYNGKLYENIPLKNVKDTMLSIDKTDILVNKIFPYDIFISYNMAHGGKTEMIISAFVASFIILLGLILFILGSKVNEEKFISYLGKIFIIVGILLIIIGISIAIYGSKNPESPLFSSGIKKKTLFSSKMLTKEIDSSLILLSNKETIEFGFKISTFLGTIFLAIGIIVDKLINKFKRKI